MKKRLFIGVVAALLLTVSAAWAQTDDLTLHVQRTFGYGAGSQIQGTFRLEARGPADLTSVTFTVDGEVLATVTAPPFEARLQTSEHALGWHELGATGTTAGGQSLAAQPRRFEFVSGDQVWQSMSRIMGPLVVVLVLVAVLGLVGPLLSARRARQHGPLPAGAPRRYGLAGGTICPKCGRVFARHWWAFNLLTGKLDRCDHCGRWSLVQALPRAVLDQAVAAELADEQARQAAAAPALSEAEKRRRALEESRFEE